MINELPNKTLELLNQYYYRLELLENKGIKKAVCWILGFKAVCIILIIHFSPTEPVYIQSCLREHSFSLSSPKLGILAAYH
jgi:hypothetical protein